jgi:hypothetical protein
MGINCLFPYLKTYSKEVNVANFTGKVAAVDTQRFSNIGITDRKTRKVKNSCLYLIFLHWKFSRLFVFETDQVFLSRFSQTFKRYLQLLIDSKITPVVVFDGKPLEAKAKENCRRQR